MFITFFDSKGIIHRESVPNGQTITGAYYLEVLKRLMFRIRRILPEYRDLKTWSLLYDNAPSHISLIIRQFLARNQVCVLNHPPYSPDLALYDFSLFPTLKLKLKECFFNDISTINPLTSRCAEFSRWLQCCTIYRKKMKKDLKLHTLLFLGSLFRMAQSDFSKNNAKPFIFPKRPKKTLFLGYDFFFNLNFHYVPDT